ncbi:MAG: 30S ribosomal protein S4e [Nanoarchaeota archaeon]|nr:30S ribosomal protein S4e [Nanoarchaeota archaeon]
MKGYLKRNYTPATWLIRRKEKKFIIKPNPGAHAMEFGLPLNIVLKDLGYGKTSRDVRNILHKKDVLVDGKKRKDPKYIIGIMDVLSFPEVKKNYRIILDKKGRLIVKEISEEESKVKISKVVGKTVLGKGKIQLNLHDGKNILTETKAKVGDSLLLELPSLKIKEVLELKKGAQIYLLKGNRAGSQGVLQEIEGKKIIFEKDKEKIETSKAYALVIGGKIKIEND